MRVKYQWTQLLVRLLLHNPPAHVRITHVQHSQGIFICIGGLGMLVASDHLTDKDYPALDMAKGDVFMIVGATLYGFSASFFFFLVCEMLMLGSSQRYGRVLRPQAPVV
jgi:hypothetical protein